MEILASRKSIYKQIMAFPHYTFHFFSMQYWSGGQGAVMWLLFLAWSASYALQSYLPCALQSAKCCQVLGKEKLQAENMEKGKIGKFCLAVALQSCACSIVWYLAGCQEMLQGTQSNRA